MVIKREKPGVSTQRRESGRCETRHKMSENNGWRRKAWNKLWRNRRGHNVDQGIGGLHDCQGVPGLHVARPIGPCRMEPGVEYIKCEESRTTRLVEGSGRTLQITKSTYHGRRIITRSHSRAWYLEPMLRSSSHCQNIPAKQH